MLTIHSIRAGFATNSSSSHSVILLPKDIPRPAQIGCDYYEAPYLLVSADSKIRFLASQLVSSLFYEDKPGCRAVVEHLDRELPGLLAEYERVVAKHDARNYVPDEFESYADHTSISGYSPEILERLVRFFKSPSIVFTGGRDDREPMVEGGEDITWVVRGLTGSAINATVKEDGDVLVAFHRHNGNKIRFSLTDGSLPAASYTKASTPELVDLKITDYCTAACEWCYQASSPKGKHAPLDRIKQVVDLLAEMEVFEVAIGGGEPTEHPDFHEILSYINYKDMVPNFTTKSSRWLTDPLRDHVKKAIMNMAGGIGVSCDTVEDLELYHKIRALRRFSRRSLTVAQHVLGANPISETGKFLRQAFAKEIPVLLLGYKAVGFGEKYDRWDAEGTDVMLKLALAEHTRTAELSVDTALVDQYPDLIRALDVPDVLVASPEGKFSCYIDAVAETMGPSSYCDKALMEPLVYDVDGFKKAFAKW